ncbi:ABC transporter substrate-binding protein [Roseomonas sp. AR75]|uniref:ABC transporter substrate-binding protein n=1 Tax=Roseomonas sp. AR75 TaxID=2562311 RepID=UPI0010C143F9|nr:ABC transporter substrate-binding protein [Roseomonas sp. AR75]
MGILQTGRRSALALLCAAGLAGTAMAQSRSLTIAIGTNINTLDPHQTATIQSDLSVISHLHAALLIRGPDMQLQPQLATAWRAVDDNTWRFTLRSGATFSNGEALDAEAVKWNFERVRNPATRSRIASWFSLVKEVVAISPTELEIRTSAPFPALPAQLSAFFLLPPRWASQNNPANTAVGAGPYELQQFVPGDRVVMRARQGWFGEARQFDTVTFRVIPEAGARIAAVMAGEVDLITGVPPSEMQRINASNRASAAAVDSTRTVFLKFNNLIPPLRDNLPLRQALNLAVDRAAIRDAIWNGMGSISPCQLLTPAYFGFNPNLQVPAFDPARARQLLAQAGIRPGQVSINLEVPVGPYLLAQDIAQAVAAQIEDIGVRVRIVEMEFGAFMNKYIRAQDLGNTAYLSHAWPTLDADGLLTLLEAGNPYAYWDDDVFSGYLRQARQTNDPARRQELFNQATQRMCDQAAVLFLFVQPVTYAISPRVQWQARGDDWMRAWDLTPR